ncbi:MAG: hypothetical protein INH41_23860 [Myxococcaceae bacterium]|jgi:hypothetical protein|nr:hypothetical protein [Myxococcaceae bacterium]MCA3015437.1 hypothetical protein [Myxococcaceae bacterium]
MIRVRLHTGDVDWDDAKFKQAMLERSLPPTTPVTLDGGTTWSPALTVFKQRLGEREDVMAVFLPVQVEPVALVAGYLSLGSLLLFGGPLTLVAVLVLGEPKPTLAVKAGAFAVALLGGVLPPALLGAYALKRLRGNPQARGAARAWFSIGVGGLLALCLLTGGLWALLR